MSDLPESSVWTPGIYQLETSDPVLGGPDGIDNLQAKQLASRTRWLKDQVEQIASGVADATYTKVTVNAKGLVVAGGSLATGDIPSLDWAKISTGKPTTLGGYGITDAYTKTQNDQALALKAPLASPALTGVPTAPTAASGVNSQQLANAAFVVDAIAKIHSITNISTNTSLTAAHRGLVLIDATTGDRTIALPVANAQLGVVDMVLRRTDITTNALVIAAAGTDKIMLDTTAQTTGQTTTELLFAGDYLCLRADGAGKWWVVSQAQLPGSISRGLQVITTVGVSSYTVPAVLRSGRVRPLITVIGAGGSGGVKRLASEGGGGGGGGGGIAIGIFDLTGVSAVTVTVGAGGLGLTAPGNGNPGGASSFGTYCSATGGNAGGGGTTAGVPVSGGLGGVGTGGQINQSLGQGSYGHVVAGGNAVGGIGGGGGSPGAVAGTVVPAYGNGSGGVGTSGASYTGDGGQGVIKIEW